MLQLTHVARSYRQPEGEVVVLKDVNFELEKGETVALLGESGSGKSTILHLISGLDRPDAGEILFQGRATSGFRDREWNRVRREQLGLVFQQYHLVPTLSVDDNIMLQARLAGRLDNLWRRRLIDELELSPLLRRLPSELSGGQQQRVAIGRALMMKPALVLADEPTGNLDERASQKVMQLFVELVAESGGSLLMVTHSQEMSLYLDRQMHLRGGEVQVGPISS